MRCSIMLLRPPLLQGRSTQIPFWSSGNDLSCCLRDAAPGQPFQDRPHCSASVEGSDPESVRRTLIGPVFRGGCPGGCPIHFPGSSSAKQPGFLVLARPDAVHHPCCCIASGWKP